MQAQTWPKTCETPNRKLSIPTNSIHMFQMIVAAHARSAAGCHSLHDLECPVEVRVRRDGHQNALKGYMFRLPFLRRSSCV